MKYSIIITAFLLVASTGIASACTPPAGKRVKGSVDSGCTSASPICFNFNAGISQTPNFQCTDFSTIIRMNVGFGVPATQPTSRISAFVSAITSYFSPRTEPAVTIPKPTDMSQYAPASAYIPSNAGVPPCRPGTGNTNGNRGGRPSGNICLYPEECRGLPNEAQCVTDFLNTHNC